MTLRDAQGCIIKGGSKVLLLAKLGESFGVEARIAMEVANVSFPILSVPRLVQAGATVILDRAGSYIEMHGERLSIAFVDGMFFLRAWIPRVDGVHSVLAPIPAEVSDDWIAPFDPDADEEQIQDDLPEGVLDGVEMPPAVAEAPRVVEEVSDSVRRSHELSTVLQGEDATDLTEF
jgi:hypothetical protein